MKSNYRLGKLVITKDNIKDFEFSKDRRKIRLYEVSQLESNILQGKHFESILVVNKRDGKLRIIDGNHRIEAIENVIEKKKDTKIEVKLAIYENLDDAEEKETFKLWNIGTKQTNDDFIHTWRNYIPIYKMIKRKFPVSVTTYSSPNALKFTRLVAAYVKKTQTGWLGGYKKEDLVAEVSKLGKSDYENLYRFVEGFIQVFGKPDQKNVYSKTGLFSVIMRIYFRNIDSIKEVDIWNDMQRYILGDSELMLFSKMMGREAQIKLNKIVLELLNQNKKRQYN